MIISIIYYLHHINQYSIKLSIVIQKSRTASERGYKDQPQPYRATIKQAAYPETA